MSSTYHRDGSVPGGGVYRRRDPRTDPRPGDMLASGHALIRVDRVALGHVLCAVFRDTATQPHTIMSLPLIEWTLATINAGVVDLPDGDPRHAATILEAP